MKYARIFALGAATLLLALASTARLNAETHGSVRVDAAPKAAPKVEAAGELPAELVPLVSAMDQELARSMKELARPNQAGPYYLGYWLLEVVHQHTEAKLGALLASEKGHTRYFRVELRVGSHDVDNSNAYPMGFGDDGMSFGVPLEQAPLDPNLQASRRSLWLLTDAAYQNALDVLEQKQAEQKSSSRLSSQAADFTKETLRSIITPKAQPLPAQQQLEEQVRSASAVFTAFPEVHDANVLADAWTLTRVLVSSEGVKSYEPSRFVRFSVQASSQAADGMPVVRSAAAFGDVDAGTLTQLARQIAEDVRRVRNAAIIEDYNGPVLFEGEAAAQLVYELLGATLSGTPGGGSGDSPWLQRLGKRVLPAQFDVFDDPTLEQYRGTKLWGGYAFDDDGVAAARVPLIERGRLRDLLMSRTPNEHRTKSNGHGRTAMGGWSQAAVANLLVEARGGLSRQALRNRLLSAVKEEGGEFGLLVRALEPREYSTSGAAAPQPQLIVKLYLDGREEPVRGAELFDLTPRALKDIIAVGNDPSAYHTTPLVAGIVPVAASIVSPSLLLEDIEIRKPSQRHELPPVLPRP
jgi:TldD protein